jgi:hypothetical protein
MRDPSVGFFHPGVLPDILHVGLHPRLKHEVESTVFENVTGLLGRVCDVFVLFRGRRFLIRGFLDRLVIFLVFLA